MKEIVSFRRITPYGMIIIASNRSESDTDSEIFTLSCYFSSFPIVSESDTDSEIWISFSISSKTGSFCV